jgi:hypothetical protein
LAAASTATAPLALVLFEGQGQPGSLNHLGMWTESADEVRWEGHV